MRSATPYEEGLTSAARVGGGWYKWIVEAVLGLVMVVWGLALLIRSVLALTVEPYREFARFLDGAREGVVSWAESNLPAEAPTDPDRPMEV